MNEEKMITIKEAVERYGITRDAIYYHAKKKHLSTYKKLGDKEAYVKVADLEALRLRPSTGSDAPSISTPKWTEEELTEVLARLENKPTRSNEEAKAIFADFREALKNKYSSGQRVSA